MKGFVFFAGAGPEKALAGAPSAAPAIILYGPLLEGA